MPTPTDTVRAEDPLVALSLAGIPFQGSMDLVDGNDIYDYKFQSRIQKFWAPTPQTWGYLEELRRRLDRSHSGDRLRFHYILISKKGAPPQKQTFEFDAETIKQAWEAYTPVVERMKKVVTGEIQPEANDNHCYKYGPCPYLGICDRGAMSFLDKISEKKAAVELPDVKSDPKDGDEPTEEMKAKALQEAEEPFDPSKYERPEVKAKPPKASIRPPEVRLKYIEVRHSVTFDVKKDGIYSATVGGALGAECDSDNAEAVRKVLSNSLMDSIKAEAERYKK